MIEPAALLAWSALALIVTLTPGPDTLLVAAHAARSGFRAGMAALMGIMTGVVWYGALIAFGALSVLVAVPALFLAVKVAGALYLAWLGFGMIRNALKPALSPAERVAAERRGEGRSDVQAPDRLNAPHPPTPSPRGRRGVGTAFRDGFFTNALNPKVALFYLAALPQFAGVGPEAPTIGVLLLAIHAAFGLVWLSFVAFAAARARTIVWKSTFVRWLEGAVGVFFLGVAGRLSLSRGWGQ